MSRKLKQITTAVNYQVIPDDDVIIVTAPVTITMPPADGIDVTDDFNFWIKADVANVTVDGGTFYNGGISVTFTNPAIIKFTYIDGIWHFLDVTGGIVPSINITATDPIIVTPNPITGAGDISADIKTDNTMSGDGSTANPFSVIGSDLDFAISVKVATTAPLAGTWIYTNFGGIGDQLQRTTNGALPNQDSVVMAFNDDVLLWMEANQLTNGVWKITQLGDPGNPTIFTRTTNSDEMSEFDPQVVIPSSGATLKGHIFGQQTPDPVPGTDNIVYVDETGIYVTQATAGSQLNGAIPTWNTVPRQLRKGNNQLRWLNRLLIVNGALQFSGVISPPAFSTVMHNWNPTGLATTLGIRITTAGSGWGLGGIANGVDGRILLIHNMSAAFMTIYNQDPGSIAINQFLLPNFSGYQMAPYESVWLQYDGSVGFWRMIGAPNYVNTGVLSVNDDGLGQIIVDNTDPQNPIVTFAGVATDATLSGDGTPGNPLTVVGGGGVSITATLPITVTPDPITGAGDIGFTPSIGSGLVGDGSPGNPLDTAVSSTAEHSPEKFRAIGDGTEHIIDQTINPDTGIAWTQAEAEAYWSGCMSKYQVNDIQITAVSIGFTYTINIGGTPYSYTAIGGDNLQTIANSLENLIDPGNPDGSPAQNATVSNDTVRVVLTTPQTITISASNMTNTSVAVIATTIDVTSDTVDWAAFQHALSLIQTQPLSYMQCGNGQHYVINQDLELPHYVGLSTKVVIAGRGSKIESNSTNPVNVLARKCPSVNAAVWMGFTNFHISDFVLSGNGNAGDTGLFIEAAHGSIIENVLAGNVDVGFDSRFCLKIRFVNCDTAAAVDGFRSWNAEYFGASLSNAGNNLCRWENCEAFIPSGANTGFYARASDCCKMDTCVVEGQPPVYGVLWDNIASSVAKNFEISNCHMELVSAPGRAVIGVRSSGGSNNHIKIENVYNQGPGIFLEADSGPGINIFMRDIPYISDQPFLRAINENWTRWHFENVFGFPFMSGETVIDPETWVTDGAVDAAYWATDFGGAVPPQTNIRNITWIG